MFFPYAESCFQTIRKTGRFYVDNTRFIPHLEKLGNHLIFLRPPRWGKSLFESCLECYYDVNTMKDNLFDTLFKGLDIYIKIGQIKPESI